MAASGAMWAKPAGGALAGKKTVLTKEQVDKLIAISTGADKASLKSNLNTYGHYGTDVDWAKKQYPVKTSSKAKPKPQAAPAPTYHDLTPESNPLLTKTKGADGTEFHQGGLMVKKDGKSWTVVHGDSGMHISSGDTFKTQGEAVKAMGDLNKLANWKFSSPSELAPGAAADLQQKAHDTFLKSKAQSTIDAKAATVAKANAKAQAQASAQLNAQTAQAAQAAKAAPKASSIDFGGTVVQGQSQSGMIVHPAKASLGGYALTIEGSKKTIGHFDNEEAAMKTMEALAKDKTWGKKMQSGNVSQDEAQAAHDLIYDIKANNYQMPKVARPIEVPAPAWNERWHNWTSANTADGELAQKFSKQYTDPHNKATASEKSALTSYQGSGYHAMNDFNWNGGSASSETKAKVAAMDTLMAKNKAPTNFVTVKSEGSTHPLYHQIMKLKIGEPYVQLGYDSSYNANTQDWNWGGGSVKVFFRQAKGKSETIHLNSLPGYHSGIPSEHEVLCGRNQVWKVVGKKVVGNKVQVIVDYVGKVSTEAAHKLYNQTMGIS
jgi:hypothetical protein